MNDNKKTWRVGLGALLAGMLGMPLVHAQDAGAGKCLQVLVETDGVSFKGLSKRVLDMDAPASRRPVQRKGFFYIEALDAVGAVRQAQSMPDPTEVYYDYVDPVPAGGQVGTQSQGGQGPTLRGGKIKLAKAQFVLRLPVDADLSALDISIVKENPPSDATGQAIPGTGAAQAGSSANRELQATLNLGAIPEEQ